MPASGASTAWLVPAAFAVSAIVTWFAIGYARRRRLVDEPGRRRSHAAPTPRGGGIGIVVALLGCIGVPVLVVSGEHWAIPSAFALVALIGWIDDHRPLSARLRLSVHAAAAILVFASAMHAHGVRLDGGVVLAALVVAFVLVAAINLHNFMDGIDGLLAVQAIYVSGVCSALSAWHGDVSLAWLALVVAAAVLGFLPFNFPRARIFMGDVGSGSLGFAIGLLGLAVAAQGVVVGACVSIACSGFVVDAGATLASRMLRGRRWYSAHREHLYQWLVRGGSSHARVVGIYLAWNLVVATPVILFVVVSRAGPATALVLAGVVHALGLGAWVTGKRRCLRIAANRSPD
ncbi:MAG: glycosyltransferase family 4 protein [Xanthomonadales bacterium]|nr:glycosyltransferase family 4 protein [Xanthomonadales bacterium]